MAQTPFDVLSKAGQAFIVSSCVYAVAKAGIADALSDSPKSAQDLADATGTHAGALRRILRVGKEFSKGRTNATFTRQPRAFCGKIIHNRCAATCFR
jgi:hypothetical protein